MSPIGFTNDLRCSVLRPFQKTHQRHRRFNLPGGDEALLAGFAPLGTVIAEHCHQRIRQSIIVDTDTFEPTSAGVFPAAHAATMA